MVSNPEAENFWAAALEYSRTGDSNREMMPAARKRLEESAKQISGLESTASVYAAKLTPAGVRNQVWQGKSISCESSLMVFETWDLQKSSAAVLERLQPRIESGFDSIVLGKPVHSDVAEGDDWEVYHVVEYDHSKVGERLQQSLGSLIPVTKVDDPSKVSKTQSPTYPSEEFIIDANEITAGEVALHLSEFPNVVLEGPPGTGKTWLAFETANLIAGEPAESFRLEALLQGRDISESAEDLIGPPLVWEIVQFHPGFGYEEFVRALRTDTRATSFSLISVDGVLPRIAQVAALREGKPTLLIIDEINRSNLSAVLGEAIFAIDPAHRGKQVRLQLAAAAGGLDDLVVPKNLLILGTMNTSDHSLAMIDFAVRRRFRFLRSDPSSAALASYYSHSPIRAKFSCNLLAALCAAADDGDRAPGHSYLMIQGSGEMSDAEWLSKIIDRLLYDVRPLFDEYRVEGLKLLPAQLGGEGVDLISCSQMDVVDSFRNFFEILRSSP